MMHIADSRRLPLDKDGLLLHLDKRIKTLCATLEKVGHCEVQMTPPEFIDWEAQGCMQWRMQVTVAKPSRKVTWDAIVAAILAVTPAKCQFVHV
jgi:hypothetical protein